MKLKSKFILWFTAFALIPVITVGTFVYVGTKKVSEESAMDTVINEQAFAMQSIQNIIMMIESAGNQASNDKQVIEFLQNSSAGTITPEEQKQLNDKLGNMVSGFAVYENIMVLNSNGKCVADGDYASSKTGQDLSGLKAYTQVKSDGVEYISKVEKSQYSANPILTLSFPIKQQNTQIGVLVQTIDLQKLSVKYIGNIKLVNKGMLFVMEADGTTIMHPDNKEILTQNIANTAGGKEIVKKKKGDSNYVYKNKMTAVYKTDSRLGWIFVAAFPTKEINLVGDKIVSTISMVGLFALIGSLILSTLIGSAISKKIVKIAKDMDHVAEGDFTTIFNTIGKDEIAHMSGQINTTLSKIRDSITHVKDAANSMGEMSTTLSLNSEQMASTTNEVATAIQDVASGASNQADDLMEVVNVVADFSKELESIHDKLELVRDLTTQTEDKAGFGSKQLDELKASIMQIQNSFKLVQNKVDGLANTVSKIGSITDVINGISRETDLLALNAAIEAARAGDAGRGFAVVAEEVRKLSEESRRSSEEIITLVQLITKEMLDVTRTSKVMDNQLENQVGTIENTISAVGDILNAIADTAPIIMDTYNSVEKANNSKTVIMDKVEAVSAVSQEVSASAEEIAASSEEMLASAEEVNRFSIELSAAAESLVEKVNVFKI